MQAPNRPVLSLCYCALLLTMPLSCPADGAGHDAYSGHAAGSNGAAEEGHSAGNDGDTGAAYLQQGAGAEPAGGSGHLDLLSAAAMSSQASLALMGIVPCDPISCLRTCA